ncbi:MAG: hypothetical protein NXH85_01100 [Pseudomonadaceae bacterium]|nr:hypothetical protein [Pseudomonadaceae bacterium]
MDTLLFAGTETDPDAESGGDAIGQAAGVATDASAGSFAGSSGQNPQSQPSESEARSGSERAALNQDSVSSQSAEKKAEEAAEQAQLIADQKQIEQLTERDREVRAHEQAHAAVGGQYAGAPVYDYTRGPNGRSYATSGHVKIDVSAIPGDPQATLQKAQTVRRAALAPAEPSSADRSVAAKASQMAVQARAEIARSRGSADAGEQTAEVIRSTGLNDGNTEGDGSADQQADASKDGGLEVAGLRNSGYQQTSTVVGSLLDTTV